MNENEEFEFRARAEQESKKQTPSPKQGFGAQVWGALQKPEQMSRQGLQQIAQMIPEGKVTGDLPMDLLRGTPRIAANTMAEAAPGFVSRGSLLGMGALGGLKGLSAIPQVRGAASELAGQLESAAGSPKGTLEHGFESAKNMFGPGKKAASPIYESARPWTVHPELQDVFENKQMIEKSMELAKQGKLSPFEAFTARKAVGKLMGKSGYSDDVLTQMRNTFDAIAKTDSKIAQGDVQFATGLKNQSLRGILPKNKYGTTSAFKTGIMAAVPGVGTALSPIVQGAGATGLGALTRMPPEIAALISSLMQQGKQ